MVLMMLITQGLVRRDSPLLVNHEFISVVVSVLKEEECKVSVLKEPLLCALVVSVAWITN